MSNTVTQLGAEEKSALLARLTTLRGCSGRKECGGNGP